MLERDGQDEVLDSLEEPAIIVFTLSSATVASKASTVGFR